MYRYMALVWNSSNREAKAVVDFVVASLHKTSTHKWRTPLAAPGLTVCDSGEHIGRMQTYCLQGKSGAVLGRLFHNDYTSQLDDLNTTESLACITSKGQHLIDKYWGRYVAFLRNHDCGTFYILRDPSGAFPCFYTSFRDIEIYFSDIQDAACLDFLKFSVNWEYLKTNIMLPQFQKTHTGLKEVNEILPAECVEITSFHRKSRFVWDPTEISQTEVLEDPIEAAELLQHTVKSTISALASSYDTIVHNLGGLDSSIALSCLAEASNQPKITAINFYTKSPRGEERFYARQVANQFDVELVEAELDYRKADLAAVFNSNKLVNPLGFFDCIGLTGDVLSLAKRKGAQALFYGVGGDNVFYQPPFNLGALDYIRTNGFGKGALKVAMEASRYSRKSLYRTSRDMLRERLSPVGCYNYIRDLVYANYKTPLVNMEMVGVSGHEKFLHPLLIPEDSALKGKYLHILISALYSKEYYDHWDTEYYAEKVFIYLTQPIVETCLRIPTWVLTYGGVDRGLARKAFQHDLPVDVIKRFSKSTPDEFYDDIYDQSVGFLRECLLDGYLVKKGFLRRDRLETVLNHDSILLDVTKSQILSYVAMEAWLKQWMERPSVEVTNVGVAV